ncbi:MAG: 3-dehydroquinate synthase [Bacteroidota bacterium]
MVHRQIVVPLGDRTYPIYVGSGMTASFAPTCQQHQVPSRVVLITDTTVGKHYLKPLETNLRHFKFQVSSVVIPPGERQKSLERAKRIFTTMLQEGVGRKSAVIALGGGVIGDLAGFVAAVYHRGVPFIQVPTTLLSQVDSSVGGKVAVNHPLGKNMIGAFYQPTFVWTDVECLKTLPEREVSCGLGEIVKYGVIWDEELFHFLEENIDRLLRLDRDAVMYVQARCCEIKSHIVAEDERETGLRMVLNYGHTVGHALEAAGEYRTLKHGEAVLLGMAAESFIAHRMNLIDAQTLERIQALVARVPLKCNLASLKPGAILKAMGHDKKSVGGKKRFVLPTRIGEVRVVENVDEAMVESSLKLILRPRGRNKGR